MKEGTEINGRADKGMKMRMKENKDQLGEFMYCVRRLHGDGT